MTVWYKQGVLGDLSHQARKALGKVAGVMHRHQLDLFVTSLRDGNHSPGSLHYDGNAFDCRRPDVPTIVDEIRVALGRHFDVVDEISHIHIEYDPEV